ncbi:hypothetical protein V2J09_003796 [Rumex salicifolius]
MCGGGESSTEGAVGPAPSKADKQKEKTRMSKTSAILWHAHQNDDCAVRRLLEEDLSLVKVTDYDNRTPLHVAALHGWIEVAKTLIKFGADVNPRDRWKNTIELMTRSLQSHVFDILPPISISLEYAETRSYYSEMDRINWIQPLADAEGAKKYAMIDLLKSFGGSSFGQNGSHFEPKTVAPPLPNKYDWEIEPSELDFSHSTMVGKGSYGEIIKARWRGTPIAVKRMLPSISDDRLAIQDFRHEVELLVKLRHPNIVQFLGAVTESKPLMLITEYLRGGDLGQFLDKRGALSPMRATNFALDIARGMACLHNEPNVIIHRDLKPRNALLVNSSADHLKVGDFGLSTLIKAYHAHDVYKLTGEAGSYRYMAPEVLMHQKYDKKVDVFSFAMIFYEMLEGDAPLSFCDAYDAAIHFSEDHRPIFTAKGFTPELKELIEECWAADMKDRPSFLEIIKRLEKIKVRLLTEHHWNLFS